MALDLGQRCFVWFQGRACVIIRLYTFNGGEEMRFGNWFVGTALIVIGVLAGTLAPSLRAQAVPDPCVAPWEVTIGSQRGSANDPGWHAVRWNRCTGETFVFSVGNERGDRVEDSTAWTKHPVQ